MKKTLATFMTLFAIAAAAQAEVTMDMVLVAGSNTATMMIGSGEWMWPDAPAGAVADNYQIGKYEVTAGQYTEFLNAKAATAATSTLLYNGQMGTDSNLSVNGKLGDPVYGSKINRSGDDGSYVYTAVAPNLPVNYVSWGDAARFTNWLHNGQGSGDMEAGVYALNGANTAGTLKTAYLAGRASDATIFLPNLDEWVKAAFYDGAGGFYDVPTTTDTYPDKRTPVAGTNTANIDVAIVMGNTDALLPVGTFVNTTSPYGAFDMAGNVNEWIGDSYIRDDWGFNSLAMGNAFAQPLGSHAAWSSKSGGLANQNDYRRGFRLAAPASAFAPGDVNENGVIDADDIDLMGEYIRTGIAPTAANYDLSDDGMNGGTDGNINIKDMDYLVRYLVETSAVDGDGNLIFGTQYGDFNLDGEIELGDLTRLGTYYGVGDTWAEGNANPHLDELIELGDLTMLGTYYGASNGGVDAIPEPMTMSLLATGACLPLFRRKKR